MFETSCLGEYNQSGTKQGTVIQMNKANKTKMIRRTVDVAKGKYNPYRIVTTILNIALIG